MIRVKVSRDDQRVRIVRQVAGASPIQPIRDRLAVQNRLAPRCAIQTGTPDQIQVAVSPYQVPGEAKR